MRRTGHHLNRTVQDYFDSGILGFNSFFTIKRTELFVEFRNKLLQ
ncbi:MAG: hypothetical protein RLZZ227_630 [Pseudomonadota bacterium]